jgi:hypothetical protein
MIVGRWVVAVESTEARRMVREVKKRVIKRREEKKEGNVTRTT